MPDTTKRPVPSVSTAKPLSPKKLDALIARCYTRHSAGVSINVLDICEVFDAGKAAYAQQRDEADVEVAVIRAIARLCRKDFVVIGVLADGTGERRQRVAAASLSEALATAERADAGVGTFTAFGVQPADYAQARAEGIAFNEADGLLRR